MAPEPTSTPKKDNPSKDSTNYRFLLALLRHTENGIIDFETAANDPEIRSASRKSCYMKAHNLFKAEGMNLMSTFASGTPRKTKTEGGEGGEGEAKPEAKHKVTAKPKQARGRGKKRKSEEIEEEKDGSEESKEGIKMEIKGEDGFGED